MPLPPEIKERMRKNSDVKVNLKTPQGEQAIIEGKTSVPFGAFTKLILKKKIQGLLKEWQEEPVIITSDLLTKIASAPGDTTEDRSKVILTALVIGLVGGIFLSAAAIVTLGAMGVAIGTKELLVALGVLLVVAVAVFGATQVHARKVKEKFIERIEHVADVFSK